MFVGVGIGVCWGEGIVGGIYGRALVEFPLILVVGIGLGVGGAVREAHGRRPSRRRSESGRDGGEGLGRAKVVRVVEFPPRLARVRNKNIASGWSEDGVLGAVTARETGGARV